MKHAFLVGVVTLLAMNEVSAQGSEVHSRYGANGAHFQLAEGQQTFNYEATVTTGTTSPYLVKLEVYHNGVQKFASVPQEGVPGAAYFYGCSVNMTTWGLVEGDVVTFVLKLIDTASGATLATHTLYGDV